MSNVLVCLFGNGTPSIPTDYHYFIRLYSIKISLLEPLPLGNKPILWKSCEMELQQQKPKNILGQNRPYFGE